MTRCQTGLCDKSPRRGGVFSAFQRGSIMTWLSKDRARRSWSQIRRELVFCATDGASRRVDNDALARSHTRSDDGPTAPAQIIGVAGAPEQRLVKLGRRGIGGSG